MDLSLVHLIIAVVGALAAWNAFIEKRIQGMYKQLVEKMEDKQEVNRAVQEDLKAQVVRLEAKIDMLIQLNLRKNSNQNQ
jgi:acetyl-CoA carboxylase carboxyltransferase component